jgi:hypothetical protein
MPFCLHQLLRIFREYSVLKILDSNFCVNYKTHTHRQDVSPGEGVGILLGVGDVNGDITYHGYYSK